MSETDKKDENSEKRSILFFVGLTIFSTAVGETYGQTIGWAAFGGILMIVCVIFQLWSFKRADKLEKAK